MAPLIGQTVSHYKILEHLGGGGMGVVYKAEDLRLKRTVALKFLPQTLTTDPEAKERFAHEAQAASALDHPNICAVHDVGETDDGQSFIVMACYEGETLKSRIERGPLSLTDALDTVVQVALGLSKAHQHGIIHRDIKPANIMVTNQGEVKILDFGLAKLSGMSMMTRTGSTVGTVAYMSPEQARGEKVDQRTDLWSLGVVLYQMLTGELPFKSDYEQALMYGIMHDEPKRTREIRKDLPENVDLIIGRLLMKDPVDRYASADDLLADLLAVRESRTAKVSASVRRQRKPWQRKRQFLIASGSFAIVLAAVVAGILLLIPKTTTIKFSQSYSTQTFRTYSFSAEATGGIDPPSASAGMSWDGNWICYSLPDDSGHWTLFFANVSWDEPRKIPVPVLGDYSQVKISPAGDVVAVTGDTPTGRSLRVISTSGGATIGFVDSIRAFGGWTSDGRRFGYLRARPKPGGSLMEFWSANKDGSDRQFEFADSTTTRWGWLSACWSPDGRSVAWVRNYPGLYTELVTKKLETGEEQQLTFDEVIVDDPLWMSNGTILYRSNRSGEFGIWAVREVGGEPVQIPLGSKKYFNVSASGDGRRMLVYETEALSEICLTDLQGRITRRVKLGTFVSGLGYAMAPDFSQVAFVEARPRHESALYVTDIAGASRRRIASSYWFLPNGVHAWSPDKTWIAYAGYDPSGSADSLKGDVRMTSTINMGTTQKVRDGLFPWGLAWIDNENLAFRSNDSRTFRYSVRSGKEGQIFEDSTFAVPILGGRYMVYNDSRRGRQGWFLVRLDSQGRAAGKRVRFLSRERAISSSDYRVWLFQKNPGELWTMTLPECKEKYLRPIGDLGLLPLAQLRLDGRQIAYLKNSTTMRLTLIENLFQE